MAKETGMRLFFRLTVPTLLSPQGSLAAGPAAVAALSLPDGPVPGSSVAVPPQPHPPYPPPPFDPAAALRGLGTRGLGHILLSAPALPSTQTLLQNGGPAIPSGTVAVADTQVAGRGRSGNAWASPPGCLMASLSLTAPIPGVRLPFVQYAVALAVVRGVKTLVTSAAAAAGWGAEDARAAGERADVRIKWPNDVYAGTAAHDMHDMHDMQPPPGGAANTSTPAPRKKLAGVLCHSTYVSGAGGSGPGGAGSFRVVAGFGVNVTNEAGMAAPGGGVSAVLDWARVADLVPLPPTTKSAAIEGLADPATARAAAVEAAGGRPALLAAILAEVEAGLDRLAAPGGGAAGAAWGPGGADSSAYLATWLHTGQAVTVADPPDVTAPVDRRGGGGGSGGSSPSTSTTPPRPPPGAVVTITGLAPSGYLLAVDDRTGTSYELHPDGNSLDFFQGLVRRKVVVG
jgi:biotin---protein ligase